MKTITIGRGDGANIIIDDELISRRHALLKVYTFGKMEIVDMGKNGTYVNGIKLRPNVPFPVSRKDTVKFAGEKTLDWSLVPDNSKYLKLAIAAVAVVVLCLLVFALTGSCEGKKQQPAPISYPEYNTPEAAKTDAAASEKAPATEGKEEAGGSSRAPEGPATKEGGSTSTEGSDKPATNPNASGKTSGKTLDELFPQTKKPDSKGAKNQKDNKKGGSKTDEEKPAEGDKKDKKRTMPII